MSVVKSYDLMTPDQQMAYRMGVTAAREAVDGIEHWASYSPDGDVWECYASDPLAAIDALEKP